MGRPFAAPPKVPADRVEALRRAFDATMQSAGFLDEAEKLGLEIQPVSGERLQLLVEKMFSEPRTVIDAARNAIENRR